MFGRRPPRFALALVLCVGAACGGSGTDLCSTCSADSECSSGYCVADAHVCAEPSATTVCNTTGTEVRYPMRPPTLIAMLGDGGNSDGGSACDGVEDLAPCSSGDGYCWQGSCLPESACDGRPNGSACGTNHMCDGGVCYATEDCTAQADGAGCDFDGACGNRAYCYRGQCRFFDDFVVECWGFETYQCSDGPAMGARFSYEISLASEATCPDGQHCTRVTLSAFQGTPSKDEPACSDGYREDSCQGCEEPRGLGFCIGRNDLSLQPGTHGGWEYCPSTCSEP